MHSSSIRPVAMSDSLLVYLLRGYKVLLLLALLGAAAGYALASFTRVQWMSKMTIQPGRLRWWLAAKCKTARSLRFRSS